MTSPAKRRPAPVQHTPADAGGSRGSPQNINPSHRPGFQGSPQNINPSHRPGFQGSPPGLALRTLAQSAEADK